MNHADLKTWSFGIRQCMTSSVLGFIEIFGFILSPRVVSVTEGRMVLIPTRGPSWELGQFCLLLEICPSAPRLRGATDVEYYILGGSSSVVLSVLTVLLT